MGVPQNGAHRRAVSDHTDDRAAAADLPAVARHGEDDRPDADGIVQEKSRCARLFLDTLDEHSLGFLGITGGEDHHQGLARTHTLTDGSIYFFLTHSHIGGKGELMQFRYRGPTQGDHVVESSPLAVASMVEQLRLTDQHPSDLVFLPDVGSSDSGYLFVTEEYDRHLLVVYHWQAGARLQVIGSIDPNFARPTDGAQRPKFVFLDRAGDTYYLGIANDTQVRLYTAPSNRLFPVTEPGRLVVSAFAPTAPSSLFPLPKLDGACQVKLIRDSAGAWSLLGFRSDPSDDPNGADYVDVYPVQLGPSSIAISPRRLSRHIFLPHGDTGFANTGTHFVEPSGRLLISSSYRWAKDEGPGGSSYVSRVDECPSA